MKLLLIKSYHVSTAKAGKVIIKPVSSDDWSLIERHSERVETTMLHQVRVVWRGQIAPLWITPGVCVFFKVVGLYPPGECATLDSSTELHVEPNLKDEIDNEMDDITENHKISYTTEIIKKLYSLGLSLIGKKEEPSDDLSTTTKQMKEYEQSKKVTTINTCVRVESFKDEDSPGNLSNYKLLPEALFGLIEDFPNSPSIIRCSISKVPSPKTLLTSQDRKIEEKILDVHLILLDYNRTFNYKNRCITFPSIRSKRTIVHENIMDQLGLEEGDRIKLIKSSVPLQPCDKVILNPCCKTVCMLYNEKFSL